MIKLFIDDLRDPPDDTWTVVRDYQQAVAYFDTNGLPPVVSFDHDLGLAETGYDVAKWIVEKILDKEVDLPDTFVYTVHSANPVGKRNIEALLDNFTKYHNINNGEEHGQEKKRQ